MERQHYLWSVGGATVTVSLAAHVIARFREAASSPEAKDREIGGVLLGFRESDDRISIESFETISSEHRRGLPFTLSGPDKRRLAQALRSYRNGLEPLGSFRTHLRPGLYMDQYDFELMTEQFAASTDVMLLIRPADWVGGFFIWEEGDISRQKCHKEFPFDVAQLPMIGTTPAPQQPPRNNPVLSFARWLPTLLKVGVIAGTAGLAAVLAFYTHGSHERRLPPPVVPMTAVNKPSAFPPRLEPIYPPVDPDIRSTEPDNPYELHVKIPGPASAGSPTPKSRLLNADLRSPAETRTVAPAQPVLPPEPLPTASNMTPPAVAAILTRPVLKPVRPTLVSQVSLEPAQPGPLRRGLHHVPVLNMFGKHSYKSGGDFSPARPLREVRPQISESEADEASVDIRVWIDDTGEVIKSELISDKVPPDIADATSNAANKWRFTPAHLSDRPVSSQMVMHFKFVPKDNY